MEVKINHWYSLDEVAELRLGTNPSAVGSPFLVAPHRLLCFAHIGSHVDNGEFSFASTSMLTWAPPPNTINPATGELPSSLEIAFDCDCERLLFATHDKCKYMYLGNIDLAGVKADPSGRLVAFFQVSPPLAGDAWTFWGGGAAWRCTVNGVEVSDINPDRLPSAAEAPIYEVFLSRHGRDDYLHLVANDDVAYVRYIDPSRDVSMASYNGIPSIDNVTLTGFGGSDWDVESCQIISRSDAMRILVSFYRSGGKPAGMVPTAEQDYENWDS